MGTDLCTSESLEGRYGAKPTMKILSTQQTINISMEEMNMTVSEHSVGFYSLLSPPWGTWLGQVSTTAAAAGNHAALHAPCCTGGGNCTQGIGDNSSSGVRTAIKTRKQQMPVALSSAKAHYMAVSGYVKEVISLRSLLCSMGLLWIV